MLTSLTVQASHAITAIVNLFETRQVPGDYGQETLIAADSGRLTSGRSQT